MALGTSNISTTLVKNTLGASTNKVSELCTHANINMWAKRKPVRDSRNTIPVSEVGYANGTWGISLPSYVGDDTLLTTYLRPTGGASEPYRLGDFRGYEHQATIPVVIQDAPVEIEKKEQILVALVNQPEGSSLAIEDLNSNYRLGVMVYESGGGLIGSASSESPGGSSINIDLTGLSYSTLTFKFCITDYYKPWGLSGMTALYEIPRKVSTENKNWIDIPLVAYTPPAAVPQFNVTYDPNTQYITINVETSTYTGTAYLQYLDETLTPVSNIQLDITSANTLLTFTDRDTTWVVGGETYTCRLWLSPTPDGAFDAETTFTAFQQL